MARLLRMPEIAADSNEAVLGSWALSEGESFVTGAVLATIETAKAAVDIEADSDGTLLRKLATEGAEVAIGSAIALIADPGDTAVDIDTELAGLDDAPAGPAVATTDPAPSAEVIPATAPPHRVFASPLARRVARDAGISVDHVRGTGPNNRIVRGDVDAAIAKSRRAKPDLARNESYVDEPHTRHRAAIATNLTRSMQTAPHFYLRATVEVDALLRLRRQLNESPGRRISINDLVVKAVALAHERAPAMNVIWTDEAVRRFASVDLAIAVATSRGLVTPVVRSVETMRIDELASATADLAERAHAGTLYARELEGGSATVTNLGKFGIEEFAAILNPPHSAIVAVGATRAAGVVRDGQLDIATVMTMTVSVDHRPVDGAVAADWLSGLVNLIEHPVRLLR